MQPWSDMPQKGNLNGDGNVTPADAAIALRLAASGAHDNALRVLQAAAGWYRLSPMH